MAASATNPDLEINRSGYYELRWSEQKPDGAWRSHALSTRTKDRAVADKVRARFIRSEAQEQAAALVSPGGATVGDVLQGYQRALIKQGKGVTQATTAKRLEAFFGAYTPDELAPEIFDQYRDERAGAKVSDGTVRRELGVLAAALAWGVKFRIIKTAPPVIELPPPGHARPMFLPEPLEQVLWDLASRDVTKEGLLTRVGKFICVALETGARRSAVTGLTWDRVDLERRTIDFRDPNLRTTKKRRGVTPITKRLFPVLERAYAERAPGARYVLGSPSCIRSAWEAFAKIHKFKNVTPHVFKHTRITLLLRAGVAPWDVAAITHTSVRMIEEHYGHHIVDTRLHALADKRHAA